MMKVTTVSGKKAPKSKCRKIDGKYYLIGDVNIKDSGDCYIINGKYYRESTGYIAYDSRTKRYVIKNGSLKKGFVALNDDIAEIGYFSLPEGYKVWDYPLIQLPNASYVTRLGAPWYLASKIKEYEVSYEEKSEFNYTCSDSVLSSAAAKFEIRYKKLNPIIKESKAIKEIAKSYSKYSYGYEFESVTGKIPQRVLAKLGLIPLRDGSVSGYEYSTIPYSGLKGFSALYDVTKALDRHTTYNDSCSLHIHIGGYPRTEKHLLALFKLLCFIEDDIYNMFPIYKRQNYGVKNKDYTKPLPSKYLLSQIDGFLINADSTSIKNNFEYLFDYLAMGKGYYQNFNRQLDNVDHHPNDPGSSSKWQIKTRYHWVNLIPIIFTNHKTIEFRIHTPTYDYNKIMLFTMLCTEILAFAERNINFILDGKYGSMINLRYVLNDALLVNNSNALRKILYNYCIKDRPKFINTNIMRGKIDPSEKDLIPHANILYGNLSKASTFKYSPYDAATMDAAMQALDSLTATPASLDDETAEQVGNAVYEWMEINNPTDDQG